MNPDARDTAARHLLGLMPPEDESLFSAAATADPAVAAACQEVEHLAAVIAVASAPPVAPSPETWQRVRAACGLPAPSRRRQRLLLWSGWGVAAGLALWISFSSGRLPRTLPKDQAGGGGSQAIRPERQPSPARPGPPDAATNAETIAGEDGVPHSSPDKSSVIAATPDPDNRQEPLEKRRLIQELATLRTELSRFRDRDRQLFSAIPGRTWPVIIEMLPPAGTPGFTDSAASSSLAARVGQALAGVDPAATAEPDPAAGPSATGKPVELPAAASPRAIPVYDPARDTGTLAIHDLPPPPEGFAYNLWVNPGGDGQPVLAGTLPADLRASDALDFSLGTPGILPSSYQLTMDPAGAPAAPAPGNIVLQGP